MLSLKLRGLHAKENDANEPERSSESLATIVSSQCSHDAAVVPWGVRAFTNSMSRAMLVLNGRLSNACAVRSRVIVKNRLHNADRFDILLQPSVPRLESRSLPWVGSDRIRA